MASAYRSVERVLYDMGGPPDARPAQPYLRLVPRQVAPGPRGPFRESIGRIDLSIAARQLSADELEIVRNHYILRVRSYKRSVRAPIIRKLASLLED